MSAEPKLNMLHAPDTTEAVVDIIAVHGLSAQASSWLSLLLPRDLPGARIFTFGYDFALRGTDPIEKQGHRLLEALYQSRSADNTLDRPLVFIAHSLGGLIVKQALICSQTRADDLASRDVQARNFAQHTKGIVFIGTPHWVNERPDRAIWKFLKLCDRDADFGTLEKRLYDILPSAQSITTNFWDCVNANTSHINLISFFEEVDTPDLEPNSSSLPDSKMANVVMKEDTTCQGFNSTPIHGNHLSIWESLSAKPVNYRRVLGAVKSLTFPFYLHGTKSPGNDDTDPRALLQTLLQVEDGRQRIAPPANGTFSWLCKNSVVEQWFQKGHRGILWINGKAGSGKSTLMKHILDHGNFPDADKAPVLIASYFFDPFTDGTGRSVPEFYRALLHQLWNQAKLLPCEHDILDSAALHFASQLRGKWVNEPSLLVDQLNLLLSDIGQHHPIYIVIDALDECAKDEITSILEFLRQALGQAPPSHLRICVSSRNTFSCSEDDLRVFVDQENAEDIVNFTEAQIEISDAKSGNSFSRFKDEVLNIILEKAAGIFLWVSLALHIVCNETKDSSDIIHILRSLPTDLTSVYQRILRNIYGEKQQIQLQVSQILSWVLFARRPLSVQEIGAALSFANNKRFHGYEIQERSLDAEQLYCDSVPKLATTFVDCTWGLVKIICSKYGRISKTWSTANHFEVHLLHSSVQDFLIESEFFTIHSSHRSGAEAGAVQNLHFSRICLAYCGWYQEVYSHTETDEQNLNSAFPFLDYCSTFWLKHLQIADVSAASGELWTQSFPFPSEELLLSWSRALVLVGKGVQLYRSSSLLHIASYYNLSRLLRVWLQSLKIALKGRHSHDEPQENPKAAASPWAETVKNYSNLKQLIDQIDAEGRTPLSLACEAGNLEICKLLIHYDADLHSVDPKYGYSPLMWAVAAGDALIVRLLLDAGADVNDHRSGTTPVSLAATAGNAGVVQVLLKYGANVGAKCPANQASSPQIWSQDKADITSRLLARGKLMTVAGRFNLTPLHHAILSSDLSTISLLLMAGAEATFGHEGALSQHRSSWLDRMILSMRHDSFSVVCAVSQPCPETNGRGSNSTRGNGSNSARYPHSDSLGKRKQAPDGPPGDDGDDDLERRPPHKRPNPSSQNDRSMETKSRQIYACPYFKYAPHRYTSQRACSTHGWPDMNRLKQHLHQKHYIFLCDRCGTRLGSDKEKQEHRRALEACAFVPIEQRQRDFADGFDDDQRTRLRDKTMKKNKANNNEKVYWEEVYKTCFPQVTEIPSPYFEAEAADTRYNTFLIQRLRRSPSARSLITARVGQEVAGQLIGDFMGFVDDTHRRFLNIGGSGTQSQQGSFATIESASRQPSTLPQPPAQYEASPEFHAMLQGPPADPGFVTDSGVDLQDLECPSLVPDPQVQPGGQMSLSNPIGEPNFSQTPNPDQSPWSPYVFQTPSWPSGPANSNVRYLYDFTTPRIASDVVYNIFQNNHQHQPQYQYAATDSPQGPYHQQHSLPSQQGPFSGRAMQGTLLHHNPQRPPTSSNPLRQKDSMR
ncbi:uncharacterized protein A1O5_10146 [Cladophialophora psammophila CBS 110553]|uniref:Uncharacterized protein n=1 Tax=Cladophialophora psammophila CBS 110553 TaxID=1182543 RepID=W9WQM7_9EURO|nr:uncharacterized protein A1O5_10146 [Cladophialophora psammophila CBS 110553]EXJ66951.1 hypothetical protein A1O5_10146 [Cladophialophora psammophila CBS 110553]